MQVGSESPGPSRPLTSERVPWTKILVSPTPPTAPAFFLTFTGAPPLTEEQSRAEADPESAASESYPSPDTASPDTTPEGGNALVRFAIHRRVTMCMLIIGVLVLGVLALQRLPLEFLPAISSKDSSPSSRV